MLLQRIARSTAFAARHGNVTELFCLRHYNSHSHNLPCPSDAFIILYLASVLQVLQLHRWRLALTLLCLHGSVLHGFMRTCLLETRAAFPSTGFQI